MKALRLQSWRYQSVITAHFTISLSSCPVSHKVIEDHSIFEKNSLRLLYFSLYVLFAYGFL